MVAELLIIPSEETPLRDSAKHVVHSLAANGIKVREQVVVCPDRETLFKAVSAGLQRSNILILLGGMGRESDFLAKKVISEGLRQPLEDSPECAVAIRDYCKKIHEEYSWTDNIFSSLPQGSTPFPPRYGRLPGCALSSSRQHIIILPETQREIMPMLQNDVLPYLVEVGVSAASVHFVRAWGISLARVEEMLVDLIGVGNPVVSVEADGEEVLVRVSAQAEDIHYASNLCTPVLKTVADRLGDYAYGLDVDSIEAAVVQKIRKKELGLAVVECGTGGMLTRIIGETEFGRETVRYATNADDDDGKMKKLGLTAGKLKKYGAVSEYAAVAMASAARDKVASELGVAVIASITEEITGLVYIAVTDGEYVYVKKLVVDGEGGVYDDAVVDAAVVRSLHMIRLFVDYLPDHYRGCISLSSALSGRSVTEFESYDDAFDSGEQPQKSVRSVIFGNFIIRKADEPKEKMKKFIFILATLVFLGCAGYLGVYYYQSFSAIEQAKELRNLYASQVPFYMTEIGLPLVSSEEMENRFAPLREINSDIVGYLTIEGTPLDYPVVQAGDNEYYMRRDYRKNTSTHGAPFLDYRADLERPSDNLVIYGHNMKDGQLFSELLGYMNISYYRDHPRIAFDTIYRNGEYKVFAVFITDAGDTGETAFNYHDFIQAGSDEDFNKFVSQMRIRSLIETEVDVEPGDELLTLSTCTYEFDNARFVVAARRIREDEKREVDTERAKLNPQPLCPEIWYTIYDAERPDVDTASIVTTMYNRPSLRPSSSIFPSDSEGEESESSRLAEESSKAEQARLAEESNRAETSRLAEESKLAEQSRQAEQSRLAEESRAAASEAVMRKQHEDAAAAYLATAKKEMESAESAMLSADSATSASSADKYAKQAETAAAKSREAADKAQASANVAGTLAGENAAVQAESYAQGAEEIAEHARLVADDWGNAESGGRAALDEITVNSGGKKHSGDALDIVSRVVQNEIGSSFHIEAIKAHAVATYTYIMYANSKGDIPSMSMASKADSKIINAVSDVIGEAVYYSGKYAFTPYHATSAGATANSKDVWGGGYSYLVSVDSYLDEGHSSYEVDKIMTASEVERLIKSNLGITVDGDPEYWFEVLEKLDGGYNGKMSVCGKTKSKSGDAITGRLIRENVLGLRSAAFDISYNSSRERFTFTTYGYGHGVGMSQNGANLYATEEGWDYIEILEHYYPGTSVK